MFPEQLLRRRKPIRIEQTSRDFLKLIEQHRASYQNRPIELAEFAQQLGITREATRQKYNRLSKYFELPFIANRIARETFSPPIRDLLGKEVAILHQKNLDIQQIADAIGITKNMVIKILNAEKRRIQKALIDDRKDRVKALALNQLTSTQIAFLTGETINKIRQTVSDLSATHEIPRVKRIRRKPEEIAKFTQQVQELKSQELTVRQIAEKLNVSHFLVGNAFARLRKTN